MNYRMAPSLKFEHKRSEDIHVALVRSVFVYNVYPASLTIIRDSAIQVLHYDLQQVHFCICTIEPALLISVIIQKQTSFSRLWKMNVWTCVFPPRHTTVVKEEKQVCVSCEFLERRCFQAMPEGIWLQWRFFVLAAVKIIMKEPLMGYEWLLLLPRVHRDLCWCLEF